MDQFTASISETPVDVRVSSEESDEVLPFRPLHPFPPLPENEGACALTAQLGSGGRGARKNAVRKLKSDLGRACAGEAVFPVQVEQGRGRDSPSTCRLQAPSGEPSVTSGGL